MSKRGLLVSALIILLLIPLAVAERNFWIETKTVKNRIFLNETAQFNITIHNDKTIIDTFDIASRDVVNWDIYTTPRSDYRKEVFPESEKTIQLFIKPLGHIRAGLYEIRVDITSTRTNTQLQKLVFVEVKPETRVIGEYVPTIKNSVEMPDKISPDEPFKIKLNLRNVMPIQMDNVKVELNSELINEERTVSLAPSEEKEIEFDMQLDRFTPPQGDKLAGRITYLRGNVTYVWDIDKTDFTIIAYESFKETDATIKKTFKTIKLITVVNEGNKRAAHMVMGEVKFLDLLFAKTTPEAVFVREGKRKNYKWEIPLNPRESMTVGIIRNYIILPILAAIIIIIVLGYYLFRSPVLLDKSAYKIKTEKSGINEIKVKLHLKNRTGKTFEHVKVVDKIPKIIEIKRDFHLGTLRPEKILRHTSKSTKIIWSISTLEPYEERIITYKIKSRLSIMGCLTLSAAYVKFKGSNDNEQISVSNKFDLEE